MFGVSLAAHWGNNSKSNDKHIEHQNSRRDGRFQIGAKNPSGIVAGTKAAKARGRASASNGKKLFVNVDCRTLQARRFRDVIEKYKAELKVSELSQVQESALRNVAALTIELEEMEHNITRKPMPACRTI